MHCARVLYSFAQDRSRHLGDPNSGPPPTPAKGTRQTAASGVFNVGS